MTQEKFERAIEIKKEIAELERDLLTRKNFHNRKSYQKIRMEYTNSRGERKGFTLSVLDDGDVVNRLVNEEIKLIKKQIAELQHEFKIL